MPHGTLQSDRIQDGQSEPGDHETIHFPKVYEDAWPSAQDKSDLDRSRIFLLRMANMHPDPQVTKTLKNIIPNQQLHNIYFLAFEIQSRIFGNCHTSFAASALLQWVRFILIKSHVPNIATGDVSRKVMDFFFDPTLERTLRNQPLGQTVVYPYPAGRLRVAIVGGGPTALASAISLAEKGKGNVEVHLWERRWVRQQDFTGNWIVDYPPTARRRDQVVTLQDSVTSLLSKSSYQALFAGRPERVWPGSANIQIRKVEDRFLRRVQEPEFNGLIHLHTEGVTSEELAKMGDFHVLLGADGAASWVRKAYFSAYENERGRSYALGLAFNRPAGLPWSQSLNVFLTLGQTRYLLNASDYDGRGYLNIQLTETEWDQMRSVDGQHVHFGRPGCLRKQDGSIPEGFEEGQVFAPSEDRHSPLWTVISDGLKLFGFKESEVINVVRIPIVVQAVREGVQQLRSLPNVRRPHALVAVAGDAAMTVHFWPGRGLNSGIKSGLALGDELVHALNSGRFVGMPLDALKEYNSFIMKLQGREHDKRSIPILNQSGTPETLEWLLSKAHTVPDNVAIEWLVGAMAQIADRLQTRSDWAHPYVDNVEPQLRIVLRQLDSVTLGEMAVSFPWPTREMAGAEVLPIRSMKPEEKETWINSLWNMLEKNRARHERSRSRNRRGESPPASSGRFEAPRTRSPALPRGGVHRSNATQSVRQGRSLNVPAEASSLKSMSTASSSGGRVTLGRMMTVHKRPPSNVLGDALSLALFRVEEAT